MELLKNNKGITLIILVVTIIVLLILAGISISAITGGNNSMDKAKKAKDETAIKAEMEELQKIINQSAAKGIRHGNYSGSADSQTIRDALKKNKLIEENPDDVIIDGKNGWKVTGVKTGQKYKIRYNGEVTRIEELAPTKIYGKIADGVLYLRATEQTGYTEGTKWNDATITKVIIEEPIAPSTCKEMFNNCIALETIENIENLHTENATDMSSMFGYCKKLDNLDLTYFDTNKVISMSLMFYQCNALKELNFINFCTDNVENMSSMFYYCKSLTNLDLKMFNTSKVKKMPLMFFECMSLTSIDLTNFNTENVDDMRYMFYDCNKLTKLNLSMFNTNKVKDMSNMFAFCNSLITLDLSCFNTNIVTNMSSMFRNCNNLITLNLSSFNTNMVTNMGSMFSYCYNLKTIYVSDNFVTTNVSNSDKIFYSSTHIEGGQGTISGYNDDIKYAHIDGGPSNPGYFTLKQ